MLPQEVIQEDRQLQADENKISERMMWLRWHWTLDKDNNPGTVSFSEYARQVGVTEAAIRRSARGYVISEDVLRDHPENPISPSEAAARAGMSEQRRRPVVAVAKARGKHSDTVRRDYAFDVDRVTGEVDRYADEHPEASDEDLDAVAERHAANIAEASEMAHKDRERLLESKGHLLTELTGELAKAREALTAAKNLAQDADRDLLPAGGLERLTAALHEIARLTSDVRILLGTADWNTSALS
jgi:hypothetical protein